MKLKFVGNGPFGSTTRKNSSAYYLREKELLIIDLGINVAEDYKKLVSDLQITKITIAITHNHPDHSGGLSDFLIWCFFQKQLKTVVIVTESNVKKSVESLLFNQGVFYVLQDTKTCCTLNLAEEKAYTFYGELTISSFQTEHTKMPSCGFFIKNGNSAIVYSGDTKNSILKQAVNYCNEENIRLEAVYHEITTNEGHSAVHTYYKHLLKDLEETGFPKEKLFVYHTNEKKEDLKKLGFNLVAQEGV